MPHSQTTSTKTSKSKKFKFKNPDYLDILSQLSLNNNQIKEEKETMLPNYLEHNSSKENVWDVA